MNTSRFYNVRLDMLLDTFAKTPGGFIERERLFDNPPEDFGQALSFLVAEGCLEENDHGYEITYRGKAVLDNGGFVRKHVRERALFYSAVVSTVVGILALVLSVVALAA